MIHIQRFVVGAFVTIGYFLVAITMPIWIVPVLFYEEGTKFLGEKKQ